MATKAQAIAALKLEHKDATLEFSSLMGNWDTNLVAPAGHHWAESDSHLVNAHWYADHGCKAEYWDYVIEHIEMLGGACKCDSETCPAWGLDASRPNACAAS